MTPESVSCPYCNSLVLLTRIPDAEQRIRCPRCQEMFPYRGSSNETGGEQLPATGYGSEGVLVPDTDRSPLPEKRRANRAVGRLVLAVMAVMASVALIFALSTTSGRRGRDQLPGGTAAKVPMLPPAKLAGLGYIPADVDFLAGIHVGELMDQPGTAQILSDLRAQGAFDLMQLERSTSLKLEDIDHIVLAANVRFRPIIVVKTRQPYDKENVQIALHARPGTEKGDRIVYPFAIKGLPVPWDASVWFANERTLVFYGFTLNTSKDAPLEPELSAERFPTAVRDILVDKLHEGTQAWCIGRLEEWDKLRSLLAKVPLPALGFLPQKELGVLSDMRAFTASVRFGDADARYHVEADCKDEATARKLDDRLSGLADEWKKAGSLPFLTGLSPQLGGQLLETLVHQQKNEWLVVEATSAIGPQPATRLERHRSGATTAE